MRTSLTLDNYTKRLDVAPYATENAPAGYDDDLVRDFFFELEEACRAQIPDDLVGID